MNKILTTGFVVFAAVLAILLFVQVTGGLISGVFPITLWFLPTLALGLAAIATLPNQAKRQANSLSTWLLLALYTTLLVGYFALNAWRFGPLGLLLVLVALLLPVVSLRIAR